VTTYAYVGRPGSGKSYSVVENQILPALKARRRVVTNIPLFLDKIREQQGMEEADVVEFPVDTVKAEPHRIFEFVKKGDLFVLDEVSKLFPAGEKVKDVPPQFISFFTEHRHMVDEKGNACGIVLVVQDLGNIGLWALRMVDFTYNHTKLSSVGSDGSFRVDIYEGPVKGPIYPIKRRIRHVFGRYTKKVYSYYKSHTQSDSVLPGANEASVDKRASILKRWAVMIGIPGGIVGIFFGIHFLGRAMEKAKAMPAAMHASGASVPLAAASPVAGSFGSAFIGKAVQMVERPPMYRITGYLLNEAHPELSRAVLSPDQAGRPVVVAYSSCRTMADKGLECPFGGWFYSANGEVDGKSEFNAPVGFLRGAAVVSKAVEAPVSQGLSALDPVPLTENPITGVGSYDRAGWIQAHR
jgi:zona occludens toxin (predicted ATPase)